MSSFTEVSTRKATRKDLEGVGDKVQKNTTWAQYFTALYVFENQSLEKRSLFCEEPKCVNTKLLVNYFLYA